MPVTEMFELFLVIVLAIVAARYVPTDPRRGPLLAILLLIVLLLVLFGTPRLKAQTLPEACVIVPPGTTFTLTGASAPLFSWTMNELVPVSSTDPTLVPQRMDGFYVQVDSLTRIDTGKLTPATCGDGRLAFTFRWPSNVPRGNHTGSVRGYNFALDSSGNPTSTRVEGAITTVPFAVVDPVHTGPPEAPANVKVKK